MTRLQKAQLRQSELRSQIAAELEKSADDRDGGAVERMTKEAQAVEIKLRAALVIEQQTLPADWIDSPEGRELCELRRRISILDYVSEVMDGRALDGASLEYRQRMEDEATAYRAQLDRAEAQRKADAEQAQFMAVMRERNQQQYRERIFRH